MTCIRGFRRQPGKHAQRGVAFIEFALLAPLLIFIVLAIFDYARAIQANNILINMSREGANLVARTTANPQFIMNAVADTADPLDMARQGGMVITRVMGRADGRAEVVEQYRWTGGVSRPSRFWSNCGTWINGTCTVPATRPVVNLPVVLRTGDMVYLVETFYAYQSLFGGLQLGGLLLPANPDMYCYTML